jgi:hypothetical protein
MDRTFNGITSDRLAYDHERLAALAHWRRVNHPLAASSCTIPIRNRACKPHHIPALNRSASARFDDIH